MAVSSSRPDPASPAAVAGASFGTVRKGFDPDEVRDFLRSVSSEMSRLQQQITAAQRELDALRAAGPAAPPRLDEDTLTALLGEETARIVHTAREAAAQIRGRAEESAAKMLRDASEESARLRAEIELEVARRRADSTSDAEAEVEMARQQGREMVNEAREYRERVLADVSRRREMARAQLEQMVHGRDRLLNAFERARLAAVDVMAELAPLGEEPDELVNLAPTTGPVALVPSRPTLVEDAPDDIDDDAFDEPADAADLPTGEVVAVDGEPPVMYDVDDEPGADWVVEAADDGEADEDALDEDALVEDAFDEDAELADADEVAAAEAAAQADAEDAEREAAAEGPGGDLLRLPAHEDEGFDEDDDEDDDRPSAPVVALFAGEIDSPVEHRTTVVEAPPVAVVDDSATASGGVDADGKPTVDDLFAKLRRASAAMVAKEAAEALADAAAAAESGDVTVDTADADPVEGSSDVGHPEDDTIFGSRDEALVPLIIGAARKLKRVLADEQNDVLDALRRTSSVDRVEALLPTESEQSGRYIAAVHDDLHAAAVVGARSLTDGSDKAIAAALKPASILSPVADAFTADVVRPLRERLDRAVMQVGEDPAELATLVRNVYREWKTQRIDEHIEDLVRLAHGRGAYAALSPGTTVCWRVDPDGPPCADAEDNALGGAVGAGEPFPTGHTHPPAHSGCRCLLETTPG